MKKLLCVILALLLTVSLFGCGKPNDEPTDPAAPVQTDAPAKDDPTQAPAQTDAPANACPVWKLPDREIYGNYPDCWMCEDVGSTYMILQSKACMLAVTYTAEAADGDLEGVINQTNKQFFNEIASYCEGRIASSTIEVTESEKCTVAGFDSLRFTGTVSSAGEYDCHIYGYTFVIDGTGVMVCGLVTAKAQDAGMIAEINTLTDAMAQSVRTEE